MASSKAHFRPERLLSFEDAYRLVMEHAERARAERTAGAEAGRAGRQQSVPLLDAVGRTLAEDIIADRDFPPFPRATRDGFALRSEDAIPNSELRVIGEIRAGGDLPAGFTTLKTGDAIAIMTGAPVPAGADAVIMVEHVQRTGDHLRLSHSVLAGENIVSRGSEARASSVLAAQGTVMSHSHIALASAVGKPTVNVFERPSVAILPTGDEVVPLESQPAANQIRNSNSYSLAAQIVTSGGQPLQLPIAPDEPERLRALIQQGLGADLLLLSGGVSAGEYDLVEDVLSFFKAEFLFTGVQIQPGKPLVFGRVPRNASGRQFTYFFGLPGNPISTMVTFELFAHPMVRALSGAGAARMRTASAKLGSPLKVKTGLTRFLPARLVGEWNDSQVEPVKWQGSGDTAAFANADCLLVVPPERERFETGEIMSVVML
ncbi:MAG: molybdopterin molybdotransferase MoeA [Acidobacteria bacterium]|nr:molybdopterin molybdotransferase MoeA [Acidobacteriota bacterium]